MRSGTAPPFLRLIRLKGAANFSHQPQIIPDRLLSNAAVGSVRQRLSRRAGWDRGKLNGNNWL
jgi:hypothetical protein